MSSEYRLSEPKTDGSFLEEEAHVSDSSPKDAQQIEAVAAGTNGSTFRMTFNSLTLDELSEELDRRTKETQRLQEEVENATRVALERFGCTHGISSSGQHCHSQRCNVLTDDTPEDYNISSTHQQAATLKGLDNLNLGVTQKGISSQRKEVLENAIDDRLQQLSDLQLNKTHNQPEQDPISPQETIVNLQTELREAQMERNVLSDLRLKDSRKHADQMEKMLWVLEELQSIKGSGDQKRQEMVQETEHKALALNKKIETLEQTIKEVYHTLHEKQCEHNLIISSKSTDSPKQRSLTAEVNEDFNNDADKLLERRLLSGEQLDREEYSGADTLERVEDVITSLGQEMATLTEKLSSSKDSGVSLSVKLELLKKLADRQTSLQQYQITELESTLSNRKHKVCCLEQQLIEAQTQLFNIQREKDRSHHQEKELQNQLDQLQRCFEQQQCEVLEEVKLLRGQLEAAREQLHKAGEEKTYLQALLDQRAQEGRKSQELLREKDEELLFRQQETKQHLASLEEAQSRCQTLQAEQEALWLKLNDSEKMIDVLRLQMESSIQMTVQHSHTIDSVQQENSLLSNQLNQHKLEIQHLRAELDQHKSDLAAVEHEKQQLQASVVEQSQRVLEETLEKQQLTNQLELQRMQLLTLTKEHKEMQRLHSCKNEEHEGVVLQLKSQLMKAHGELDQVRSTMRTLEGADGHGLQVALDMQKEITVRREQVDTMQGRIQHLEENMEELRKEKRYQNRETQRQLQELTLVKEEKKQLANELEALRSKDQQLRGRIGELEAILHKMSESFANCQDFIQLQEQEFFRLKLQHALDLKELQGQNVCTALNVSPLVLNSPTPSAHTAAPSSQHASNTQIKTKSRQESPACELRSLIKDLRGVISENHRPHTNNSFHRRRSAPEKVHRATFDTDSVEDVKAESRLRRKTCGSEPRYLKTAEQNGKIINNSFSESHVRLNPAVAARYASSLQLLSLGRRSPVYSLLTSDPTS
ncbi:coiled-coil domain-containing protein 158 [Acanthochromis polyacanthus]|uniref:coiled-coil domain-containing protein 158 n=1 Tax=Acanthochromis polyacanthus TaxID=80966 RepID=UPI0022349107|nr:coiled-coil domain-containing protein 158 [Acanthochromis polyacanthus]XP_022047197.2 coiled-coil domain-containing protein 158 [Acanthochromis polyacanthus]XP_051807123.1 coiled-coil domain-containing protein 158 [Acanthochromis polyacanthus]